ncbi:carboxypeptidase-like regulatory domain-containing protein, partial [Porphyromonas sp.]
MNRLILSLLLLGLGISYGLSASAQTKISSSAQPKISSSAQAKLSGRVLDERRQGVEAAIVLLITSPDSVLVASTLTDSLGRFSLSSRPGDFVLCVRNLGYKEARRSLRLESSEQLGDIQLEPEARALGKVVVTARRSRPLTTVTQGKIQLHVAQSYLSDLGSALDVLKHAPGITVSSKGEISLATIGGTALYVNGKKLML